MPTVRHRPDVATSTARSAARPSRPRLLIVDESSETRDVLRAAMERRGWEIFEAPEVSSGLDLARRCHPDVIVLDADSTAANDESSRQECESAAARDRASLVVLGQWKSSRCDGGLPSRVVRKPFHFEPLVRLIEELSAERRVA